MTPPDKPAETTTNGHLDFDHADIQLPVLPALLFAVEGPLATALATVEAHLNIVLRRWWWTPW